MRSSKLTAVIYFMVLPLTWSGQTEENHKIHCCTG